MLDTPASMGATQPADKIGLWEDYTRYVYLHCLKSQAVLDLITRPVIEQVYLSGTIV
jgi:hypothetical protein